MSYLNSSSRVRLSGLVSGLDTATLVKASLWAEQSRIDKQFQSKVKMEWKTSAYYEINTALSKFRDTYMSVLNQKNNIASSANFRAFKAVYESKDNAATITALSGAKAGNIRVESIETARGAHVESTQIRKEFGATRNSTLVEAGIYFAEGDVLSIEINGKPIHFTKKDTIQNVLDRVKNVMGPDVKFTFSDITRTFTLETTRTGTAKPNNVVNGVAEGTLQIKDTYGDFFRQLGMLKGDATGATITATSTTPISGDIGYNASSAIASIDKLSIGHLISRYGDSQLVNTTDDPANGERTIVLEEEDGNLRTIIEFYDPADTDDPPFVTRREETYDGVDYVENYAVNGDGDPYIASRQSTDSDGYITLETYNQNGQLETITRNKDADAGNRIEENYVNGKLASREQYVNGDLSVKETVTNGVVTMRRQYETDGTISQVDNFNASGKPTSTITQNGADCIVETYGSGNSAVTVKLMVNADIAADGKLDGGTLAMTETYNESDVLISRIIPNGTGSIKEYYDANKNVTTRQSLDADGSISLAETFKYTKNADGVTYDRYRTSATEYTTNSDGKKVTITETYGNVTPQVATSRHIKHEDGSETYETINSDGTTKSTGTTYANGRDATVVFTMDGDPAYDPNAIHDPNDPDYDPDVFHGHVYTSSSNEFTVEGLNFVLRRDSVESFNIDIEQNMDDAVEVVKTFIDAYNELYSTLSNYVNEVPNRSYQPLTDEERSQLSEKQIEDWEMQAKAGLLRNDSYLSRLLNDLRAVFYSPVTTLNELGRPSGSFMAANAGITTSTLGLLGGQLTFDETKFREALAGDPDLVAKMFTQNVNFNSSYSDDIKSRTSGNNYKYDYNGIAARITNLFQSFDKNVVSNAISPLKDSIRSAEKKLTELENAMYRKEEQYYARYTAMETALSNMQSQSNWITSMLGGGS